MMEEFKKLPNGVKFFLAVSLIYILTAFFQTQFAVAAFSHFGEMLWSILPVLLIVYAVMFLVNFFLKPGTIQKHLGNDSGLKGWVYTVLASLIISGPPYVLYPLFGELREHGMKKSFLAVFFGNRTVQPAFLPVMIYYFGWPFSILVSLLVIVFSVISGVIIGRILPE